MNFKYFKNSHKINFKLVLMIGILLFLIQPFAAIAEEEGYWILTDILESEFKDLRSECYDEKWQNSQGSISFHWRAFKGVCNNKTEETFSATATWDSPPSKLIPGETIPLKAKVIRESNTQVFFVNLGISIDKERPDIGCGIVTSSLQRIGRAEVHSKNNPATAQIDATFKVPTGSEGETFALRFCAMKGGWRYIYKWEPKGKPKPPPPPPKKPVRTETFRIFGTIRDANGHLLPHLRLFVKIGDKEKSVTVGEDGAFEHKADLPVPLSEKDIKARIRVYFNCYQDGKTWFQLMMFPRPANLQEGIVVIHKFDLDGSNKEIQKDINFGSSDWTDLALTNIDTPSKLKKISVIYRNTIDAWKFASKKLEVDLSGNIPLRVEIESREPTVFDYPNNIIRLEEECTLDAPTNTFVQNHEFGHYVQYTAYGKRWIESAAVEADPRNKAHGGYANDDAGDSFIEGFATYFAGLVAKHRDDSPDTSGTIYTVRRDDSPDGTIGTFGSLQDPWKVWEHEGKDEELAFAAVLWDLTSKAGLTIEQVWDVLKKKRGTFFLYYDALFKTYPAKKKDINACFLSHGVYSITLKGNFSYDVGEAFIDTNNNQRWDPGETFIDYSVDGTGRMSMATTTDAVIGQSANYERVDKRYSTFRFPNSFLRIEGEAPLKLQVRVSRRDGSLTYEYTAPVFNNRIHIPLLPEEIDADVSVMPVGSGNEGIFYSKTTAELAELFMRTRSTEQLDSVLFPPSTGVPTENAPPPASWSPPVAEPGDFSPPSEDIPTTGSTPAVPPGSGALVSGGGGGGGSSMPKSGNSLLLLLVLPVLGLMMLAVIVVILNRRRSSESSVKVRANLEIIYQDGSTQFFAIEQVSVRIGQSPSNNLCLQDQQVSSFHAIIEISGGRFLLRDLESTNGTIVNGKQTKESLLYLDDEITMGSTRLILRN